MKIILKKISALIIAAGTLSSIVGSVGASAAGMESYTCKTTHIPGKSSFAVNLSKSNSTYSLIDTNRNIKFISCTWEGSRAFRERVFHFDDIATFTGTPNDITQQKLATLYNVDGVYDWYSALGYNAFGPNTSNPTLYVSLLDETNAISDSTDFSILAFGKKDEYHNVMSADRDIVGHEITHIVVKKKLGWYTDMGTETIALMEAYCDILGELSDDNQDWKIGNDLYSDSHCVRDLANPASTKSLSEYGKEEVGNLYTDYRLFKSALSNGTLNAGLDRDTSRADAARGSTVISHAAYIMNQSRYGISRSDLAKIWYKSISYYGSKTAARVATFADCRKAVTQAANDYYMSLNYSLKARADKLEIMNNAFDSANIPGYSSVRQNIAANSTNMSNFVRATSQKYPSGKVWSGSDSNIYYPTFSEGYKKFDYINGGTYDISARFAQQLQTEYYGIKHFLHLTNSANYLPRIGDHLRISSNRSIFITGVSGSTITYVDCNANGDSKVAWSKTGTFTKNSNGTFRIKLGSTYYSFVWVERPVKLGDLNGDSNVNQTDINLLKQVVSYGTSYNPNGCNIIYRNFAADLNKDGNINSTDTNLLTNATMSSAGINYEFIR